MKKINRIAYITIFISLISILLAYYFKYINILDTIRINLILFLGIINFTLFIKTNIAFKITVILNFILSVIIIFGKIEINFWNIPVAITTFQIILEINKYLKNEKIKLINTLAIFFPISIFFKLTNNSVYILLGVLLLTISILNLRYILKIK
jgi:hypothetical protein